MSTPIETAIARADELAGVMIDEYAGWRGKLAYGPELHAMYMDTFAFVNFRVETADTCLLLIRNGRVADALGLCRSLLENHLLFMLMCRGTKLFKLEDLTTLTEGQFKQRLAEKQAELAELQAAGKTPCLAVEKYPKAKRHLMYVFHGYKSPDPELPDFMIPEHYFHFRQFRPESLRLNDDDYFQFAQPSTETKKKLRGHQENQQAKYRFYLSYDALLQCLELNGLAGKATLARIEAHYTFLGRFLHPTHDAARGLHEQPSSHDGKTHIGLGQPYAQAAILVARVYVCYLLAATLDEAATLFEQAPGKYMADPGTTSLRAATKRVPAEFPYFWFLFNDPPLYDRFLYGIHHASDDELAQWGGYENVPSDHVEFHQYIYSHFKDGLNGWPNHRVGQYRCPLA
jgi:hypothetical protein